MKDVMTGLHYDEALGTVQTGFGTGTTGFRVKSWQERLPVGGGG